MPSNVSIRILQPVAAQVASIRRASSIPFLLLALTALLLLVAQPVSAQQPPVPTITSVTPGAAGGGPTLTVVTTNPDSTTYDVVIQIKKMSDSWPASRETFHQLPSGVSRDTAASGAGSNVFTGFERGRGYDVRAHLKTRTATPTVIDESSPSKDAVTWRLPRKPTDAQALSTLWSTTLTVDAFGDLKGCDNPAGGLDTCTDGMAVNTFTFGTVTYMVKGLYTSDGRLTLRVAPRLDLSLKAGSLRIGGSGGSTFSLSGSAVDGVRSWNGAPSWSDDQQVTVEILVPADSLTVVAGEGKLSVSWAAPADTGGLGAAITGYDVQYKETSAIDQAATTQGDPSTGWVDAGHSDTTASAEIAGLTGSTQYDVRVRALNGIGSGSAWTFGQGTPQYSTFSIADATGLEGLSASLAITLSQAAPNGGVAFNVSTDFIGQTASSADVGAAPATVTVAVGQTTATLAIPLAKDALDEPSESFEVSITTSAAGWSTISDIDNTATVTITDNTPVVSFGSASYQVTEGDGAVEIDVNAVGDHPGFTVFATATVGTAGSADFTEGTWPLEFGVGDDTAVLSIPIASDVVYDYAFEAAEETFTVTLSTGSDLALGSPAATIVTIHDAGYCHTVATPPGKPSFNSVTPAETSITLTWNAPSTEGSGMITDFIFYVYSMDGQYLFQTVASSSDSAGHSYSKTISGLTANTTYMVKMRARTIFGCYSPYTDKLSVTTLQ